VTYGDTYYWAGGRRIGLRTSPDVVVDLTLAAQSGLDESDVARIRDQGRSLTASTVLLPEQDLPEAFKADASLARAFHPVFRADDGTLLAVLPEVRVEAHEPNKLAVLERLIADGETAAIIKEQRPGRLVLEPASGRGADALTLANTLFEEYHPDLAQARFLRVIARPDRHAG
jgi:hypothetical protein